MNKHDRERLAEAIEGLRSSVTMIMSMAQRLDARIEKMAADFPVETTKPPQHVKIIRFIPKDKNPREPI